MVWTDEQMHAITGDAEGNILVSAAAGSGKTAVLVERVLRKVLNGTASVDRLLVVTFTEAAAAEMREKIIKRLSKELENKDRSIIIRSYNIIICPCIISYIISRYARNSISILIISAADINVSVKIKSRMLISSLRHRSLSCP